MQYKAQYLHDTVLCAHVEILAQYVYNTLLRYTKDTVLCAHVGILAQYVI